MKMRREWTPFGIYFYRESTDELMAKIDCGCGAGGIPFFSVTKADGSELAWTETLKDAESAIELRWRYEE